MKNRCPHLKRKDWCKFCNVDKHIHKTILNMIKTSKSADKKRGHYDIVNFVDYCFMENLIEDSNNKCHYCNCEIQFLLYQKNLGTIERLDPKLGHIKSNCVIACRSCNLSRVGSKWTFI